jgi:hypothetical protein
VATDTMMTGDFSGKPRTQKLADTIEKLVEGFEPTQKSVKGQATFRVKRKFLWMWTYGHTADGTLYVTVLLDRELKGDHFHYVKAVSANRWNHHVVVRSAEQIESGWFKDLIKCGVDFARS